MARIEGRDLNIANFNDLYTALEREVSNETRPLVIDLRARMVERTPPLNEEDC